VNFSLGSRHFEAESRPSSGTRLTPLDHVSVLSSIFVLFGCVTVFIFCFNCELFCYYLLLLPDVQRDKLGQWVYGPTTSGYLAPCRLQDSKSRFTLLMAYHKRKIRLGFQALCFVWTASYLGDSVAQWLASRLVTQEVVSLSLIAAVFYLLSET